MSVIGMCSRMSNGTLGRAVGAAPVTPLCPSSAQTCTAEPFHQQGRILLRKTGRAITLLLQQGGQHSAWQPALSCYSQNNPSGEGGGDPRERNGERTQQRKNMQVIEGNSTGLARGAEVLIHPSENPTKNKLCLVT